MRPADELLARVELARVIEPDGCHSLKGSRTPYPAIGADTTSVTRLLTGCVPGDGLTVRHSCDQPWCINREHLIVGTQKENIADMDTRGRRTLIRPGATLTEADVAEIRASSEPGNVLAEHYGVGRNQIYRIRGRRRQWQ